MLKSKLLTVPHYFFTREGGISEGIYAGLNCGPGSGDKPEHVAENRRRALEKLGGQTLCTLYQIHSAEAVTVTGPWQSASPQADGMVTNVAGIVLGILTADCAPVLFADKDAGVIGAAHAGWKGAHGGIIGSTVKAMERLGAARKNIAAAIGPCIHQKSYEVGPEFVEKLVGEDKGNSRFFADSRFDLPAYVQHKLALSGITEIDTLPCDTYPDEAQFYSFRRTTHRKEPDYGRQLSAIMLG